jgi:hypothetical protein
LASASCSAVLGSHNSSDDQQTEENLEVMGTAGLLRERLKIRHLLKQLER